MEMVRLCLDRKVGAVDLRTQWGNLCLVSSKNPAMGRRRPEEEIADLGLVPRVAGSYHFQLKSLASCLWRVVASQIQWA